MFTKIAPLALAALAAASPVQKRQEESSTIASVITTAVPIPSEMPSPSMSAVSMSGSAMASGASGSSYPAYPCPSGYSLTYVLAEPVNVDMPLDTVVSSLPTWSSTDYPGVQSGMGGNDVGATRTLNTGNMEVLSNFTMMPSANVAVQWTTNLTSGPISLSDSVMLSNYSTVIQVYVNSSVSSDTTSLKTFCNFCASDQEASMPLVRMSIENDLNNLAGVVRNMGMSSGSMSMSGMMSASMMSASSVASIAASATDAAASMATEALSSAAEVTSSAAAATSTAA